MATRFTSQRLAEGPQFGGPDLAVPEGKVPLAPLDNNGDPCGFWEWRSWDPLGLNLEDSSEVRDMRKTIDLAAKHGRTVLKKLCDSQNIKAPMVIESDYKAPEDPRPPRKLKPELGDDVVPTLVIGSGFGAIMAGYMLQLEGLPYELYDRLATFGGVWHTIANATSKVQTDHATYSAMFGGDQYPDHAGEIFPSRSTVARYATAVARKHGIDLRTHLSTEVQAIYPSGDIYEARVKHLPTGRESTVKITGSICAPGFYPGPMRHSWPGEASFAGPIGYGVANDLNPRQYHSKTVVVVGTGAFAVENIRTAIECGAGKVQMIARRKSMICPRPTGFICNLNPLSFNMEEGLIVSNPYYRMMATDARALPSMAHGGGRIVMTQRNSPMSDIYFLSQHVGLCEQFTDSISKIHRDAITLTGGDRIEAQVIVKSLGADLAGRAQLDDVYQLKSVNGFWINGNPAHMVYITSSRSFGVTGWGGTSNTLPMMSCVSAYFHFMEYPEDYYALRDMLPSLTSLTNTAGILGSLGVLGQIPRLGRRMQLSQELRCVQQAYNYQECLKRTRQWKHDAAANMPFNSEKLGDSIRDRFMQACEKEWKAIKA
eukprot:gnl/TRDRNA2_/TRDRNA2_45057_c0_seq1.p1 gnl/TRDRNA2_/TRDRNA2_45057_c0~~gnl/TRDRNA2_/TRDRNA2_45057_c0_seq1.p1  ORF type:complete len:599 (-),score=95.04 gnl/TRDRNA2_/TRDRNA2_45057_c0_seq1:85-1881(-)